MLILEIRFLTSAVFVCCSTTGVFFLTLKPNNNMKTKVLIALLIAAFAVLTACQQAETTEDNSPQPDKEEKLGYHFSFVRTNKITGESCLIMIDDENAESHVELEHRDLWYDGACDPDYQIPGVTKCQDFSMEALTISFLPQCEYPRRPHRIVFMLYTDGEFPKIGRTYTGDNVECTVFAGFAPICLDQGEIRCTFTITDVSNNKVSGTFTRETDCELWTEGKFEDVPLYEDLL